MTDRESIHWLGRDVNVSSDGGDPHAAHEAIGWRVALAVGVAAGFVAWFWALAR